MLNADLDALSLPAVIAMQIETLITGVLRVLGEDLHGVYAHGSLALGCFNPQRSDIDLLAVIDQPLPATMRRELARLMLQHSLQPRPIEISLLARSRLEPWQHPTPYEFHFSEDWRDRYTPHMDDAAWSGWHESDQRDGDLAAHISVARARGIRLYGAPISTALPPVPTADYLDSILDDIRWARQGVADNPVYVVLNMCRVWMYLATGAVCSKQEGGAWALTRLPPSKRTVIAAALRCYASTPAGWNVAVAELQACIFLLQAQIDVLR